MEASGLGASEAGRVPQDAALIDKSDTFKATDHIPTLTTLAYQLCFAAPEDPACAILHNTLQAERFKLLMRTLKIEVQTHRVWLKKCKGVDTSNFWARQAFKVVEYDFLLNQTLQDLTQQFMNGELFQLPSRGKLGTEFDECKLESKPPPPALTKLVIDSEDSNKLVVPLNLVKTWQFHTQFGEEFSAWMDGCVAAGHSVSVEEPEKNDATPGRKRGAASAKLETESHVKKQKTDKSHIISMQDITEALILEGKINDDIMINLRAQHKVYIVNKGKKEASLTV